MVLRFDRLGMSFWISFRLGSFEYVIEFYILVEYFLGRRKFCFYSYASYNMFWLRMDCI